MTASTATKFTSLIALACFVAGCSGNGDLGLTSSITPEKTAAATTTPRVDPACASLASQIDTLRQEGSIERLEKAAAGKSSSVQVKRAALAKQAELNKAYADFQTKCGPAIQSAQATQASATPAKQPTAAPATRAN